MEYSDKLHYSKEKIRQISRAYNNTRIHTWTRTVYTHTHASTQTYTHPQIFNFSVHSYLGQQVRCGYHTITKDRAPKAIQKLPKHNNFYYCYALLIVSLLDESAIDLAQTFRVWLLIQYLYIPQRLIKLKSVVRYMFDSLILLNFNFITTASISMYIESFEVDITKYFRE